MKFRELGKTGIDVSVVGLGGVTLGEMYERVPEERAAETLDGAWAAGMRLFDTSPWYGRGLSELRFGASLRQRDRDQFVLSTKVGRTFHRPADPAKIFHDDWVGGLPFEPRFDYTYTGIMRSFEQSLMRLGLNTIDVLLIHDLDLQEIGSEESLRSHRQDLADSGWRAIEELRSTCGVRAAGAGINAMGLIPGFLERFDLDFFLVAMPFTLLDQPVLDSEFPLCEGRGVGVIVGSPFASGILASGSKGASPYYNYLPATRDVLQRTAAIEKVCARHSVSLKAAAFNFPLLHPIVASVVSGAGSASQAEENAALAAVPVPRDLWLELRDLGLIHPGSPVPRS
jgi:D-threo-aldose 1-dehydrogenase